MSVSVAGTCGERNYSNLSFWWLCTRREWPSVLGDFFVDLLLVGYPALVRSDLPLRCRISSFWRFHRVIEPFWNTYNVWSGDCVKVYIWLRRSIALERKAIIVWQSSEVSSFYEIFTQFMIFFLFYLEKKRIINDTQLEILIKCEWQVAGVEPPPPAPRSTSRKNTSKTF